MLQQPVSYTHLRAHETDSYLVCRLLLEKKKRDSFFFLMIRRPPRSTPLYSSAASDVYKRQGPDWPRSKTNDRNNRTCCNNLSLIHISEPTRRTPISYAVFCLKKKKETVFFF